MLYQDNEFLNLIDTLSTIIYRLYPYLTKPITCKLWYTNHPPWYFIQTMLLLLFDAHWFPSWSFWCMMIGRDLYRSLHRSEYDHLTKGIFCANFISLFILQHILSVTLFLFISVWVHMCMCTHASYLYHCYIFAIDTIPGRKL